MSKKRKILLGILIPTTLILIIMTGGLIFLSQSYDPMQEALNALESSTDITITKVNHLIVFDPANRTSDVGLFFYPGGNVEPESYSKIARGIALNGSLVVIVKMPFDLAIFSPKRGSKVMEEFPGIDSWVIGGHSLGGTMAANHVYSDPEVFTGLVLLASYPQESKSLSSFNIPVLTIYASLDGVVSKNIPDTISFLPATNTTLFEIVGGNHANFGSYTQASLPKSCIFVKNKLICYLKYELSECQ